MRNTSDIAVTLDLKVPANVMEKHMPASPYVVGEQIAEQILEHVNKTRLGYFPALDYFRGRDEILDEDLLNAADNITWLVSNMVRDEIIVRLRPVFARVAVESVQAQAYKLPGIRPQSFNLEHALISHYTPDHFRVALVVTPGPDDEHSDMANAVATAINHCLNDSFSGLNITSVSIIEKEE